MSNVYDDVKTLAGSLSDAGLTLHAGRLNGALSEGATGTEIFMILRSRLSDVVNDGVVPRQYKDVARELRDIVASELK
ncbi:hypothetical protein PTKU46_89520 [Paraburkholderia terrae]|uniref:hypothetical protein n=1 Tax=Paraburkholderia terrae TaxID=311230 RepID=UPI0030E24CE1